MRVTNIMTNQIAKESGLPIYSSSTLLQELKSSSNSVIKEDLSSTGIYTLKGNHYEDLEKQADRLVLSAENFSTANINRFVENYNEVMTSLKGTSSVLNDYYRQMMEETAIEHNDILQKLGITLGKNGNLNLDKTLHQKLEISKGQDGKLQMQSDSPESQETLENLEVFFEKVAFLAERISSNARANAESFSSQYNASGNMWTDVASKLNLWG